MESIPPTRSLAHRVAPYRKKLVVLLIALLVIEGATLVVWSLLSPKYQYSTMSLGMLGQQEIRKNKSTGETQVWGAGKWQKIEISGGQVTLPSGTQISVGGGTPAKHPSSIPSAVLPIVIVLAAIEVVLLGGLMIGRTKVVHAGDTAVAPAATETSAREPAPPTEPAAVPPPIAQAAVPPPIAVSPPIDEVAASSADVPTAVSPPIEPAAATPPAEPTAATPPAEPLQFCPGCGTAYADDDKRFCTVCGRARTESV